jgi:transposase
MNTIGIDMSMDTFHAAFDDTEVRIFKNTKDGIKDFFTILKNKNCTQSDTVIGTESTGVYHLLFCTELKKKGWHIKVINPILTHKMIANTLRRIKTDRTDALAIRRAVLTGVGYLFTDTPEVLALKALVQEREALCRMRAETKQRIHAHGKRREASGIKFHDSFRGVLKLLSYEIEEIEGKMSKYVPETQMLLRTIPGVGKVSAAALVAYIGDVKRFSTPEKLTAYLGLDCRVHESGVSIKGKGYMTKRGNTYLRFVLFNAASVAKRKNPHLKAYFEKKIKEGKHYFSALCAVERKLVHLIFAVWTRGTPYQQRNWVKEKARPRLRPGYLKQLKGQEFCFVAKGKQFRPRPNVRRAKHPPAIPTK